MYTFSICFIETYPILVVFVVVDFITGDTLTMEQTVAYSCLLYSNSQLGPVALADQSFLLSH